MAQDKITEAAKDTTPLMDAPPSYTPTPTTAPAAEPSSSSSVTPDRVHAPTAPFSNDLAHIGPDPANVVCPRCHYGVRTNTKSRAGTHAGVWAAICCLTCGVIAAILPLVIPSCQDVEHTCPNCGFLMARFRRGVDSAKVFPVDQGGYIAASQSGPQATPPVQFAQQSGIAEPAKK